MATKDMAQVIARSREAAIQGVAQARSVSSEPLSAADADDIIRYHVVSDDELDADAVRRHVLRLLSSEGT